MMPNIKTQISFRCFDTGNSEGSLQWLMDSAFVYKYQPTVWTQFAFATTSRTDADISIVGFVLQAYIQLAHICSWYLFVCPMWQALTSSIVALQRVYSLLLLECSALKFHISCTKRQRKRVTFQRQSQNLQKLGLLLLQTWCQHVWYFCLLLSTMVSILIICM
jgi:hypothetical protein